MPVSDKQATVSVRGSTPQAALKRSASKRGLPLANSAAARVASTKAGVPLLAALIRAAVNSKCSLVAFIVIIYHTNGCLSITFFNFLHSRQGGGKGQGGRHCPVAIGGQARALVVLIHSSVAHGPLPCVARLVVLVQFS